MNEGIFAGEIVLHSEEPTRWAEKQQRWGSESKVGLKLYMKLFSIHLRNAPLLAFPPRRIKIDVNKLRELIWEPAVGNFEQKFYDANRAKERNFCRIRSHEWGGRGSY